MFLLLNFNKCHALINNIIFGNFSLNFSYFIRFQNQLFISNNSQHYTKNYAPHYMNYLPDNVGDDIGVIQVFTVDTSIFNALPVAE